MTPGATEPPTTAESPYGPRELNLDAPSAARAYDYFLGGSHNYAADREFAHQVQQIVPWVANVARLNRSFLWRAVRFMTDAGIRQFLDLGSGIPTVGNVHEIAQQQCPGARVIYVDYEPVAYHHAQSLLADNPDADIIMADIRDPDTILHHPKTLELLDFDQPLGLLVVGVLLFIGPQDQPEQLIRTYRQKLAPGSYLAISHLADEHADPQLREQVAALVAAYQQANEHVYVRTREQIATWFEGMDLLDPGICFLPDWRPDQYDTDDIARPLGYGGVSRKP